MSTSRFALCALAGAVTLALQTQAFAEEPTIVVTGTEQGSALPAWTNSATKSAVAESKTPQVINTIAAKEIEQRHASSVNEILRYAPGVSTEVRGSTSYMSEYKIRGFNVDQEFYNGLQLPYNVTGNTKARIDPLLIESVDILKGPSSVLYGGGSPGGLVNIQSKKPQKEAKTELGFNTGNRNLKEGYLDSTGQIANSDWNYRLLGKATESDEQAHTTRYENYLVAPSVTWQPDDKTRLTIDALAQNTPSLTPSDPMPLSYLRSKYADRRDYAGDEWSGFKQRQWMLGYSFEHEFDSGWGFNQKARYFDVDTHQRSAYSTGTGSEVYQLNRFAYTTDEDLQSFNIDNQVTRTVALGDWQHHLLAGFDYQKLNSHFHYRYASSTPGIDMRNPDHSQIDNDALGLETAQKNRLGYQQNGYYLQDQIAFGGLNVLASLRFDDYRSVTTNYLQNGDKAWVSQDRLTKRLGALYAFENGLSPFISYSEGFAPVSPQGTLTAKDVKPTTSKQVEGGVKYLLAEYATTFTASVFNIRQKNVVTSDPGFLNYRQTGEVESKGAELSAISRPTDNLTLIANYAYTHAINTEDDKYQGKRPTQVPENAFNLWGDYTFDSTPLRGLTLGAGARYTGPMEISPANDAGKLGGTTQYDLAASYRMGELAPSLEGLTLKASAQNVTNKETLTCYDATNCWIGRDRTFQVGASYSF
ncbi:TonB-dependent siderophore receptor [Enterobacter hormaechei]|uniref:TonB-dependent siderophore receptor n=1 Tax=Enterobacter cloacae complex TaxID=354276 RepID=UPI00079C505A|nr:MULTISPECIES: TonB-dependent siderophore receptor [Enterobacter cloacae complex]EMA0465802.1 TonB-dependent siderophore receptor [Enterobacter hormaechei subsp. hoffmannii]HCJ7631729.1 TonB-dependent siderophore receptor [Enterobacter hormaechei subsp. xiangfangensis]EKP1097950.1 TonB-dependent siderophore receptor [Enterobacter hormaechei]EKS6523467.1 TonB-dependent siderophore receptor [Enterobacter hormaechei]EKU5013995.1 TonB-dependent siderophore receptor [Enterobacter hormaechei]